MQWDESKSKSRESDFYGGAGYGGSKVPRPLEYRVHDGSPPRDGPSGRRPRLQKATMFVSRCQNLKSEFNDRKWAGKVNDGGFIYTAANGGTSAAGKNADGGLRSYAK